MIYVLRPKTSINEVYDFTKFHTQKNFSEFESEKVKQIVKDNKIKNNYHDAQKIRK